MGIETIAGVTAGSALLGGYLQADAAENAGHMQSEATNNATAEQRRQFDLARADQQPFLQTGQGATVRLRDLLLGTNGGTGSLLNPFTPGDLQNEPGYQFGLGQGNKAIENAARSRGMYMSPATVKELMRYGQDYAGTKYGDAFNRDLTNRTTTFNMLSGAAGGGQVAANTLANAGQASATNIGNLVTAGANARGAAGIAGANAYGNALNTIGNNAVQSNYLNRILGSGGGMRYGGGGSGYGGTPYGAGSSDFGYYDF